MDIHLRDLKYFEAVADLGHVGQAADKLGRTQPALTKAVQRLGAAQLVGGLADMAQVGHGLEVLQVPKVDVHSYLRGIDG